MTYFLDLLNILLWLGFSLLISIGCGAFAWLIGSLLEYFNIQD